MKNVIKLLMVLFILTITSSCGLLESFYDGANYESLTNETGTVYFYSGGKLVNTYPGATVIYSSSDTQAMWIEWNDKDYYLQGDVIIDIE